MIENHIEKNSSDSKNRDIDIEIDQRSVTHTLHTLHKNNKKEPRSIRLRPAAYEFISNYARLSRMTVGDVVEQACFFYIDYYPVDGNVFIIEKNNHKQNLDEQIQDMICVDKLEKFLERMKAINGKLRTNHKEDFLGILKECKKVNIRSDRLSQLLSEAMTYFE